MGKSRKKLIYIFIIVVVLLACGIGVLVVSDKTFLSNIFSNQSKTEKIVAKMGDEFYQGFYYKLITNGKTASEKADILRDKEFTVSVEAMQKVSEIDISELYNSIKEKEKYDWELSSVIIEPQNPYDITDYTIKVELVKKDS